MLAYLAIETPAGFRRRDQVVGLFWPDLEQEAARTQLRKALFAFREILGSDAIQARGDGEIRLDPQRVWCDAVALGEYLKQGRWGEALALHRGDLLVGLYPRGVSQEFEEWLAARRRALREQAAFAAWECSRLEESSGDPKAAAVMARRALALTPDDETGVRQLMTLLDRQGDRAGALRVYGEWQDRLQSEYGVEPAPETRKLARKIQAARKGESHETPPVVHGPPEATVPRVHAGSVPGEAPARMRRVWLGLGVGAPLLLAVAIAVFPGRAGRQRDDALNSLAVLPLRVIGGSLPGVADGFSEELATALITDTSLRIRPASRTAEAIRPGGDMHELGRRLGVAYLVDGGVQHGAARVRLTLRLVRTSDGIAVWAGSYELPDSATVNDFERVAADASHAIRSRVH